jgi:hypothetical protein
MKTKHRRSTKSEEHQRIINDWMAETGNETIDMTAVARWAIDNGRWRAPRFDPARQCARDLSRAAREEFYTDPQGREVRKKHCFTVIDDVGQHRWLWVDIVTANRDQMQKSAQARRRMALGDVVQLKTDLSSWNDNNQFGSQIEMSFNFDEDIEEMLHPTVYPGDEEDADLEN